MLTVNDLNALRRNPSNFLLNNTIFSPMGESDLNDGIKNFGFGPLGIGMETVVGFESAVLVPEDQNPPYPFTVYYLPWKENESYHVNLGVEANDPDIMLTGRLTGCAIGSQSINGNGDLRVHHCNILSDGTIDIIAQRDHLQQVGATVNLNKQNYKLDSVNYSEFDNNKFAHVIGVRQGGIWSLYAQFLQSDQAGIINVTQVRWLV